MYPVSDDDLEFLESYLDDALSDDEVQALRSRLACEAPLAAALRMLREERSQRQAFFQTVEPTPKEVEHLVSAIHSTAHRRQWWRDQRKIAQWASAVAACLAIGLLAGLFYRGLEKTPLHSTVADDVVVTNKSASTELVGVPGTPVRFPVEVTDENGKVIAVQHFDNPREATDFANDLHHMQNRHRQNSNGVMLIDNDF